MSSIDLIAADGPADPPSSRPRAGVLDAPVFAFSFDPSVGVQRIDVPGLSDVALSERTVLHWAFYADGPAATHRPHAALAVAVDVRLSDGTRLSAEPRVRDRYDVAVDADAQFAARWSFPEQWNADTVSLAPFSQRTGTVELVLGSTALVDARNLPDRVSGFVQLLLTERIAPPVDLDPVERVDTRRGTHAGPRFSRGNTIPAVAMPHGFTFLTPATDAADSRWPYRPYVHDDHRGRRLEALQFSHQPSPWIGDRSVLQLMPFLGDPSSVRAVRRRWIVPGSERARPHHYAVDLDNGLHAEITATAHTGALRVRSDDAGALVGFVIDQLTGDGDLTWTDDGFEGWIPEGSEDWGNAPRCFFAGVVVGSAPHPLAHGHLDDDGRGRVTGFLGGRGALEIRVGVSFLSADQARHSLELEAPRAASFEDLRASAAGAWNRLLSRVSIPPLPAADAPYRSLADEELRAHIAAALHRMHLYPNSAAENTGTVEAPDWRFADVFAARPTPRDEAALAPIAQGEPVVNNGYWDTYRTEWPALALLDPSLTGRLLDGQLEQYRRGGWMARWSAPGYVDSMVGTSSDQIFADAARWGVPFDRVTGFESAWRNACEPGPDPRRGRKGIGRGRFTGYISSDVPEGMSWSIENAVSDAALGRLATQLADSPSGSSADSRGPGSVARYRSFARYFANRALSYRQLFDARTGFFRGRDDTGSFAAGAFDPRVWGGDNVETNAWGMSVGAVHDGEGLAALHGGRAQFGRHLDALFREPETAEERFGGSYGTVIHEQREARALRSGMCAISNQPAHHIPFMYAHSDRPWRGAEVVYDLARRLFGGAHIGQGYPGDEDNGEMSAWWLWAALGLYPLELASGALRIGSPLCDDILVRRGDGSSLRIRSRRSGPAAHILEEAWCDGIALEAAVVPVDALSGDVVLDLVFGTDPARALEHGGDTPISDAGTWRCDLTSGAGAPVASAGVSNSRRLFDDGDPSGDDGVALHSGEWVGWRFPVERVVSDLTVTAVSAASSTQLLWESQGPDGHWNPLEPTYGDDLLPDRTTPFALSSRVVATAIRVCALATVRLRQIELFDLD